MSRKPRKPSSGSALEAKFALCWRALNGPQLKREHQFFPGRRWKFDFADLTNRIAFEVEGGVWQGGRHTRGIGFIKDCEKYNAATATGWRVFRVPTPLVTLDYIGSLYNALYRNMERKVGG